MKTLACTHCVSRLIKNALPLSVVFEMNAYTHTYNIMRTRNLNLKTPRHVFGFLFSNESISHINCLWRVDARPLK